MIKPFLAGSYDEWRPAKLNLMDNGDGGDGYGDGGGWGGDGYGGGYGTGGDAGGYGEGGGYDGGGYGDDGGYSGDDGGWGAFGDAMGTAMGDALGDFGDMSVGDLGDMGMGPAGGFEGVAGFDSMGIGDPAGGTVGFGFGGGWGPAGGFDQALSTDFGSAISSPSETGFGTLGGRGETGMEDMSPFSDDPQAAPDSIWGAPGQIGFSVQGPESDPPDPGITGMSPWGPYGPGAKGTELDATMGPRGAFDIGLTEDPEAPETPGRAAPAPGITDPYGRDPFGRAISINEMIEEAFKELDDRTTTLDKGVIDPTPMEYQSPFEPATPAMAFGARGGFDDPSVMGRDFSIDPTAFEGPDEGRGIGRGMPAQGFTGQAPGWLGAVDNPFSMESLVGGRGFDAFDAPGRGWAEPATPGMAFGARGGFEDPDAVGRNFSIDPAAFEAPDPGRAPGMFETAGRFGGPYADPVDPFSPGGRFGGPYADPVSPTTTLDPEVVNPTPMSQQNPFAEPATPTPSPGPSAPSPSPAAVTVSGTPAQTAAAVTAIAATVGVDPGVIASVVSALAGPRGNTAQITQILQRMAAENPEMLAQMLAQMQQQQQSPMGQL